MYTNNICITTGAGMVVKLFVGEVRVGLRGNVPDRPSGKVEPVRCQLLHGDHLSPLLRGGGDG